MSGKTIELNSGSIITRDNIGKYDEKWTVHNKALSTCYVTLDLTNCSGCSIEGHEGEIEVTEEVEAMQTRTIFVIRKTPPFSFKVGFSVREEPISIQEQEQHLSQYDQGQDKIDDLMEKLIKIPFEIMDEEELEHEIRKLGYKNFVDPCFPPLDRSIYDVTSGEEYPLSERPVWKRPHEYMNGAPQLFEDDIDPNDIRQGALGNCWFLASIASLAESPALVRRLFITDKYNEFGIYKLRICKNGEWVVVTIDDYIPCYLNGGPMFSSANGNELWAILLEKAYAKLHGNYWQLRAGFVHHGMMDLSGCPTTSYQFPKERTNQDAIKDYADNFWNTLVQADNAGWIMCAGTPGVDTFTEGGGPDKEAGIVPGHAYSIIAAKQYRNTRLLNIRNPWGQFEWDGKWSDYDKKSWTRDMVEAFKPNFEVADGSFWMDYSDFFANFDSLSVCKVENWKELRLKGKFIKCSIKQKGRQGPLETCISQFYYSFRLEKDTHIEIGIHQEDDRILGADKRPYLDISYTLLKREDDGTLKVAGVADNEVAREVEGAFDLEPGHYIVVPRSTGALLNKTTVTGSPISLKIDSKGRKFWNPKVYSILYDIFRKIDLQLDGMLTARELNLFGKIVNEPFFKNLTQESPEIQSLSTFPGLAKALLKYSDQRIKEMLNSLGYDDTLYSYKSRVFVLTFHSSEDIRVRIGDAAKTDLNEKALNLVMGDYLGKFGADHAREDTKVVVFRKFHEKGYANTYAAVNKTGNDVLVDFDMTSSTSNVFMPQSGKSVVLVPARGLATLGS